MTARDDTGLYHTTAFAALVLSTVNTYALASAGLIDLFGFSPEAWLMAGLAVILFAISVPYIRPYVRRGGLNE